MVAVCFSSSYWSVVLALVVLDLMAVRGVDQLYSRARAELAGFVDSAVQSMQCGAVILFI
jgi:hypothetical protein